MERDGGPGSRSGGRETGQFQRLLPRRLALFQGFPMRSSYCKHQCVCVVHMCLTVLGVRKAVGRT